MEQSTSTLITESTPTILHGVVIDLDNPQPKETKRHEFLPVYLDHLALVVAAALIGQVLLIHWKRKNPRSYQTVSMYGLWLVPFIRCVYYRSPLFILMWSFLTITTIGLFAKPSGSKPRLIYKWFYWVYTVSSICAFVGFVILVVDAVTFEEDQQSRAVLLIGHVLCFYALYSGVLVRDFCDYLIEKLAHRVADNIKELYRTDPDVCAICGRHHGDAFVTGERSIGLACGHQFHEYCLYGWALVGKKDTCPFCKERVGISRLFSGSPLQKPAYLYGRLLSFVRYLVLWLPILFLIIDFLFFMLGFSIEKLEEDYELEY